MGVAIAFSATEIIFHPLLFWMYGSSLAGLDYKKIFSEIIMGLGSWDSSGIARAAVFGCNQSVPRSIWSYGIRAIGKF